MGMFQLQSLYLPYYKIKPHLNRVSHSLLIDENIQVREEVWKDRHGIVLYCRSHDFSRSPRTNLSSYALTFKKGGLCHAIHIVKKGLAMMGDDIRETTNTTYKECGS